MTGRARREREGAMMSVFDDYMDIAKELGWRFWVAMANAIIGILTAALISRHVGLFFILVYAGFICWEVFHSSKPRRTRFEQRPYYQYAPQPDITVYELARLTPVLVSFYSCYVEQLPEACKRHFKLMNCASNKVADELQQEPKTETDNPRF
jgi:hypothetical protein